MSTRFDTRAIARTAEKAAPAAARILGALLLLTRP